MEFVVTQIFTQCGYRAHSPVLPGTVCDVLGHKCFMGNSETKETWAKKSPVDRWVLIYYSMSHPGDSSF